MQNYKRGYNFEIRVRDKFRDHGFVAERKAASAPYDLLVMKDGQIVFLIDAKKTGQRDKDHLYVERESIETVLEESDKIGTQPLIVYGFYRSPIYVGFPDELLDEEGRTIRLEESLELDEFLEKFRT